MKHLNVLYCMLPTIFDHGKFRIIVFFENRPLQSLCKMQNLYCTIQGIIFKMNRLEQDGQIHLPLCQNKCIFFIDNHLLLSSSTNHPRIQPLINPSRPTITRPTTYSQEWYTTTHCQVWYMEQNGFLFVYRLATNNHRSSDF